jgi:hypothetical protein
MHARIRSKVILFCCFLMLVTFATSSIAIHEVYADRCNVAELSMDYPTTSTPGQSIAVNTSMLILCAQWRTYYTGRADLVDAQTKSILSSSSFDIGWKPSVTATVSNTATAPSNAGPWRLELIIYLFEDGGMVAFPIDRTIAIQVGTLGATTQQTTRTVALTSAMTTATTEAIVTHETSPGTSTALPLIIDPSYIAAGTLLVAVIVVALAIMMVRKRNA